MHFNALFGHKKSIPMGQPRRQKTRDPRSRVFLWIVSTTGALFQVQVQARRDQSERSETHRPEGHRLGEDA